MIETISKILKIIIFIFAFSGVIFEFYLQEKYKNHIKIMYQYNNKIYKFFIKGTGIYLIDNFYLLYYLYSKNYKHTKLNKLSKIYLLFYIYVPFVIVLMIIISVKQSIIIDLIIIYTIAFRIIVIILLVLDIMGLIVRYLLRKFMKNEIMKVVEFDFIDNFIPFYKDYALLYEFMTEKLDKISEKKRFTINYTIDTFTYINYFGTMLLFMILVTVLIKIIF